MKAKTDPHFLTLPFTLERDPPPFEGNDICYSWSIPRYFINRYSKKGDRVLDPFAGLGTTLFVAEELGRVPYGVEAERERFEWTAGQVENWQNVFHEDSAKIAQLGLPKMDLCVTSPPFMPIDHDWNPLYSGNPVHAGYPKYLARMRYIFSEIEKVMKKNALLVVHLDNLRRRRFTPLIWDVGQAIAQSFRLENDVVIRWDNPPDDYPYAQCLIFRKV